MPPKSNGKDWLRNTWRMMKLRCSDPRVHGYKHYGGKGITVCDEWQDYETFKRWAVTSGYQRGLQIHRADNAGNYQPSNCSWVTKRENLQRKVSPSVQLNEATAIEVVRLHAEGRSVKSLAAQFGTGTSTIYSVINGKSWTNKTGIKRKATKYFRKLTSQSVAEAKKLRSEGHTVTSLAIGLGVTRLTLSRALNGHSKPNAYGETK